MLRNDRYMTASAQLRRAAAMVPNKLAYSCDSERQTYRELDDRVGRLCRVFVGLGVERGDRIALFMGNNLPTLETYFACSRLGAVAVPINARWTSSEVAYVLVSVSPKALVFDDDRAEVAVSAVNEADLDIVLLAVGQFANRSLAGMSYERAIESAGAAADAGEISDLFAPLFIMHTSGTTGRPKGAVLTEFAVLMSGVQNLAATGTSGGRAVSLTGTPLSHVAGTTQALRAVTGMTSVLLAPPSSFDPDLMLDLMERERVTACFFVPSQWEQLCGAQDANPRDLGLEFANWGAAPATLPLVERISLTFPQSHVVNVFGQTEMSGTTCLLRGDDAVRKLGSIGTPLMTVEARLVDEEMHDVPDGEIGEIVYRGPTMMDGYWNSPEETAAVFEGGWLHSGDLCERDPDGFLWVVGRKKDMIISGGENIYPAELEAVIAAYPGVRDVAVVGVPHVQWGETPWAAVVPVGPAYELSSDAIVAHCKTQLASFKQPSRVTFLVSLPRNATGKVLKSELRALLLAMSHDGSVG